MKQKIKKILGVGNLGRVSKLEDDSTPVTDLVLCEFSTQCSYVANGCTQNVICRIKDFYKRYGDDYRELGVGGKL